MVSSIQAYLAFLGLLASERGIELALSRRNSRLAFLRGGREHGQAHFRLMAAFHGVFLASCAAEALILHRSVPGALAAIALIGAIASQGLRYWAIATLGARWNVKIIVVPGDEPVTAGPYRFIRHPNYVAVAVEMVCVPLIHGCWLTAIVFSVGNALLLRTRIRAEEAALGDAYAIAFADRPRFLPRFHRDA
jgi:methyltransferase